MPNNYTPDDYQQAALKTWYQPDDPRYLDPRHPLIKLAGEAGEILDLFGKHEYKPGFDWWDCKHCAYIKESHLENGQCPILQLSPPTFYTPLVLDELGDWWYYLRIATWQQGVSVAKWTPRTINHPYPILTCLSRVNKFSALILDSFITGGQFDLNNLYVAYCWFCDFLDQLNCTLDHLTELNYRKLNSEPGANGWIESEVMPTEHHDSP